MINKINKKKLKKVINSLMIIGMFVLLFSVSRPAFAVASGVDKTTQDEIRDRKSTRLNSSHRSQSRMPSSA